MWLSCRKLNSHTLLKGHFYFKENSMDREIWKDIEGYNGKYIVSNMGRVARITKMKGLHYLKGQLNHKGYLRVNLIKKHKYHSFRVHRLVGLAFIPNPLNKPQINHKDGNKLNNRVDNLEWVTNEENYEHAIKHNLVSHREKPVALYKNGIEIARYKSISDAARQTKVAYDNIYYQLHKCKHKCKKTKENVWAIL